MTRKKIWNAWQVADSVGLNPIVCPCGRKFDGNKAIEDFFMKIIDICKKGEGVRIKDFGVFSAYIYPGQTYNTPVSKTGIMDFDDVLVLKLKQSSVCKKILNDKEG